MTMLTLQNAKFNVMCNNFWKKQTISFCEPAKNFALINLSGTFILQTQSLSFLGFNFGKLLFCQAEQNNQHQVMQKKKGKTNCKERSKLHFIIFLVIGSSNKLQFCMHLVFYHFIVNTELSIKVDIFLFAAYLHTQGY